MKSMGLILHYIVGAGFGCVLMAGCGSLQGSSDEAIDNDIGHCTNADCAREVTGDTPTLPKSAPGTITIKCGVFKDNAEVATPCESVVVRVFPQGSATQKAEVTLSGESLVITNIGAKEIVNLNLSLKGCAKPNLLPGLKSGDTRETYFKTPCK